MDNNVIINESNPIKRLAYDEKYEKYYNHMNDNLDEEYTSINNLIGQIKPLILCDEIYGEPHVVTIKKYGVEASHTITVFIRYGKELAKCVIQAFPITGYGIGKVRLVQLKEIKLENVNDKNKVFEILKMCNNIEITKILSSKSSISIIFHKASKSLCEIICGKFSNTNSIMLNNGIKIKNKKSIKESSDDIFDLPSENNDNESYNSVVELLDNTDPKNVYLSSDWHLYKNHYKKEKNLVNTTEIIKYCKNTFKENTVFLFLGDLTFRYANKEDNNKAADLIKSIPGKKILILGNHDKMLGEDVYSNFGFDYVFEKLEWNNILFTHRPEEVEEGKLNIHGHIHDIIKYNTTDGKRNINVYPDNFSNKPVTLHYLLNHIDELTKDNEWNNNAMLGECVNLIKSIVPNLTYDFNQEADMETFYNEIKKYKSYGTEPNNACIIIETKRSEIPTEEFGIPQERKYPLDTESHVRSAVKMFNYVKPEYEKQLATAVIKKMKKFGINDMKISKENRLYKYIHEAAELEKDFFSFIPSHIKNIIFDMGDVLIDNNTVELYEKSVLIPTEYAEEIYDFIGEHLFGESRNSELLNCDLEYAIDYFKQIAPSHFAIYADEIFKLMGEAVFKFNYTDKLIDDLRARGYKLYYLSNWDRYSYNQQKHVFDSLLNKFDGGLFSFEAECEKPDTEIYYKLIDKYDLLPSECFFFDDREENIKAGNKVGMWGIVYTKGFRAKVKEYYNTPTGITESDQSYMVGELNYKDHNWWHLNIKNKPAPIDEELFSKSIEYAILNDCKDEYFKDSDKVDMFVYTCNGDKNGVLDLKLIPVGIITIYKGSDNKMNWDWEWAEQNDIKVTDDGIINLDKLKEASYDLSSITRTLNEWSMSSVNPILGTNKPFILKVGNNSSGLLSKTKFAFSPNLLDNKYFVINEDGYPEYVKENYFEDSLFEIYEFVGPKERICEMFRNINLGPNDILPQDYIYNELSGGRILIDSDQIKFDENFKLIEKN